jgi:CheY-like chemotaxis protein/AraC-like DNA-binding protein
MHRKLEETEEPVVINSDEEEMQRSKDLNVLLVEDNDEIIDYVKNLLENKYNLLIAKNGREGINQVSGSHPDLIITDLMMPEMDGIEMTSQLKSDFATSHIPIIMLTAKSQIEDQIQGIETGAEAYILKPFNADYLLAVISTIIKQREIVIRKFRDKKDIGDESLKLTTKDERFMNEIIRIIEENYTEPSFNVEKLVEKSTVGRTVMYNKIKGLTGSSPVEFLREMRLHIASNLLIESGYNVSEVGYMSGFNDIKYFSKCFKTHFGMTPTEFKNRKPIN